MFKKGFLIIISGPSGVGKSKICEELFRYQELNLIYSISMTTRKKRNYEKHGINYFFVSKKKFFLAIKNNELLEYTNFIGNYYGTPKLYCEEQILLGRNVILEIEVDGAIQIMKQKFNILSFFLLPPNFQKLENRIRSRNSETEELLLKRLNKAKEEINWITKYNFVIINNILQETVKKIICILKKNL